MIKALFLIAATCLSAFAQPVISGVTIDKVSHSSVRVLGTSTPGAICMYVKYGTTAAVTDGKTETRAVAGTTGGVWPTSIGHAVTGLDPATTYYFKLGASTDCVTYGESAAVSQTTAAAPSNRYARPAEPIGIQPVPASPTSYDRIYNVVATNNCNGTAVTSTGGNTYSGGMQESINHALANGSGSLGEHIVWPENICKPTGGRGYMIGARTGGGTGWVHISPATIAVPEGAQMTSAPVATVSATASNGTQGGAFELLSAATKVRIEGLQITGDVFASAYKTVSAVAGSNITVTGHGRSEGQPVTFYDGNGGVVRNAKLHIVDANTVTVTASTLSAGTISVGWKMAYSATEIYCLICVPDALATNPSNIVIGRNYFKAAPWPMGHYLAIRARGDDWNIIGNQFIGINSWAGFSPDVVTTYGSYTSAYSTTGGSGMAITPTTTPTTIDPGGLTRRLRIEGNYFDSPGITIFAAGGGGTVQPSDHLIRRNVFRWHTRGWGTASDWDGYHHVYRQHLEYKTGERIWITGNVFGSMYNMSETGNFSQPIVFTPRTADSSVASTVNVIKDVIIEYNTVTDNSGFVNIVGLDHDGWAPQVEPTKRFLIQHNIAYNINGYTRGWSTSPRVIARGAMFHVSRVEDVAIYHNTLYDFQGSAPGVWFYQGQPATGLDIRNNIFGYNSSTDGVLWDPNSAIPTPTPLTTGSSLGKLKKAYKTLPALTATYNIKNNLFISGREADTVYAENVSGISEAACKTDWDFSTDSSNVCAPGALVSDRLNYAKFLNRTSTVKNLRLRYDSPAKKRAASRLSDDGTDLGADIGAVLAAQGKLEFRPKVLAGAGLLRYYAPTTADACRVKLDSGTPTSDGAGARPRSTAVSLSGVSTVTLYCGVEVYTCSATGGTCSLQ